MKSFISSACFQRFLVFWWWSKWGGQTLKTQPAIGIPCLCYSIALSCGVLHPNKARFSWLRIYCGSCALALRVTFTSLILYKCNKKRQHGMQLQLIATGCQYTPLIVNYNHLHRDSFRLQEHKTKLSNKHNVVLTNTKTHLSFWIL